ncbi:MAG: type II toxin-antitoxin system RelE/ParE family toxin [Cyanobacteria bacterium]|nr:type II toxin-antitoxin system RelE/ParE family toxin [Cyanobacteriota bacterium]
MLEVRRYITKQGRIPLAEWLDSFRDRKIRQRIQNRLLRLEAGNLGDCKSLGQGLWELRLDFGSGYRIYYGQIGLVIILLLCAGDKSSQSRDIELARSYWREYESRRTDDG